MKKDSLLSLLSEEKEIYWENTFFESYPGISLKKSDILDAAERLKRFQPFIMKAFPEVAINHGEITSPLKRLTAFKTYKKIAGDLLLKMDNQLPISGSIKARGGFYEVLKHAESLALENNLISIDDNYSRFADFKDFFSTYSISVGSTGNLGLSIGLMGSKLGFNVNVHMSRDAMPWKKDMLRSQGVTVYEYDSDYSYAVESARKLSKDNPKDYFIDDENSVNLFLGYSTAALEIERQLNELEIEVSKEKPLFVYLPCGVGGGPGGITFGLKETYGDHVHCFFGEPVQSPAFLLGVYTQLHDQISVNDIGLHNQTIADGLAVGRPSGFVGRTLNNVINGFFTCKDDYLKTTLKELYTKEGIFLEPSAVIGCKGLDVINPENEHITHVVWGTGGALVPEEIKKEHLNN